MIYMHKARVISGELNVRKSPSQDAKIIRRIQEGKVVKVYEYYNEWVRIGFCQWVQYKYLQRLWENG